MPAVNRVLARACIVAGLGFAAGCVAAPSPNPALAPLRVIARIDLENLCREGVSPPIAIQNPAPGTASYSVRFTNISVLIQTPQQFTIAAPADPRRIPAGALSGYEGPCPGDLSSFRIRIEVMARGVGDDGLAYGLALTRVRSVNRLAQQQWRQAGRIRPDLEDDIDEAAADAAFDAVFDRGAQDSFAPFLGGGTGRNRDDLYVPR